MNDKYLSIFLLILLITLAVFLRYHSNEEPLERDITTYAYIAHNLIGGDQLYSDLWDHKPPGIYIVYALAELIWGYNQPAITYLGIFFTVLSAFFLYHFLKIVSNNFIAIIGVAFWIFASNSIALQANQPNVEVFINTFSIMGIWALAKWHINKKNYLILSGSFFAIASFFKMIVAFPVFCICIYLFFPFPKKEGCLYLKSKLILIFQFLIPSLFLWAITFTYFFVTNRISDFWEAVFIYNQMYSGSFFKNVGIFFLSPDKLFNHALMEIWILALLSIGWLIIPKAENSPVTASFYYLLLIGTCIQIASPGKYYPHYYQLLIPILCILSALLIFELFNKINSKNILYFRPSIIGLIFIVVLCLSYWQFLYLKMNPFEISKTKYSDTFVESYKIGKYVENITLPGDKIYEWGAETGIYYYSKKNAASGTFYIYPLLFGDENRVKFNTVLSDIVNSKPKLFILNKEYLFPKFKNIFLYVQTHYELINNNNSYMIYRLKGIS